MYLIIDDDSLTLRALLRMFSADGVVTATTIEEGICLARELSPDLIIVDRLVGSEDGIDAVPALLESCPLVMVLSSYTRADDITRAVANGACVFVDKIHLKRLPELCDEVLSGALRLRPSPRLLH